MHLSNSEQKKKKSATAFIIVAVRRYACCVCVRWSDDVYTAYNGVEEKKKKLRMRRFLKRH